MLRRAGERLSSGRSLVRSPCGSVRDEPTRTWAADERLLVAAHDPGDWLGDGRIQPLHHVRERPHRRRQIGMTQPCGNGPHVMPRRDRLRHKPVPQVVQSPLGVDLGQCARSFPPPSDPVWFATTTSRAGSSELGLRSSLTARPVTRDSSRLSKVHASQHHPRCAEATFTIRCNCRRTATRCAGPRGPG